MLSRCLLLILLLILIVSIAYAGNTGKIAGRVTDASTGEALVGIGVTVVGTSTGAATNVEGKYTIINIPPGTYTLVASGVGYQRKQVVNVKVSADFTTVVDFSLNQGEITLDAVVVQAESPMVRKDLTSSYTVVDASVIETLPVESVGQILTLQAGVVQGAGGEIHIRGGRSTEIGYSINGVSILNPYDNSTSVQIATNAIEELSVISGTFNAEYGNAQSGIVNAVTKEGGTSYHATISFNTGDYASVRDNIFTNIDAIDPWNHYVIEGTISGPIVPGSDVVTIFASARDDRDNGYLYGVREHNPEDYVVKNSLNPNQIQVISTGDGAVVPMSTRKALSTTGKLAFALMPAMKLRYDAIYSNSQSHYYNHDYKYNPSAILNNYEWGLLQALELRRSIGERTYYTIKGSYGINNFKQYKYPLLDPAGNEVDFNAGMTLDTASMRPDTLYQPDYKSIPATSETFLAGGTINSHYYQRSRTWGAKFDITSQMTSSHEVKFGLDYRTHSLQFENFTILRDTVRYFMPVIPGTNTPDHDAYTRKPVEFSAYLQDKMEFSGFILNVGLRYDYLASNARYAPNVLFPSPQGPNVTPDMNPDTLLANAPAKNCFSPRIGVSIPITERGGVIHFSYGHFYQMPPFRYLYANPDFKYTPGTPTFGNANLNPERTVTYEIGLQQPVSDDIAFIVTGFYKDVRDLLAAQQIRISNDATYYKYVNKDYGNIRGFTFSMTKRRTASDIFGFTIDYTFQTAEGNDTNADAFFLDLSSGRQSEKIPVALSWDQTHTLNMTATVGKPSDWNVSVVGRLGTGLPYTPQITQQTVYLETNSGRKPSFAQVDLLADKTFAISGVNITAYLKVYNLFDTMNERAVYNDTGRATYTLQSNLGPAVETDKIAATVPGVHSATEYLTRPDFYGPPREVRVGLSMEF